MPKKIKVKPVRMIGGRKVNIAIRQKQIPNTMRLMVIIPFIISWSNFLRRRYQMIEPPSRQSREKQALKANVISSIVL